VAAPVRWDLCAERLAELGVSQLVELPPASTLTGLAKRALPGVTATALRTPADLDQLTAAVA
jgi:[acyl-carrier-protein] S-malonyltransferase